MDFKDYLDNKLSESGGGNDENNYYEDQLNKIIDDGKISFQFKSEHNSTKWIDLDSDSAEALSKFLDTALENDQY